MQLQDIRQRIEDALKVRIPAIDPNEHPAQRIDAMEKYIVQTAEQRQLLEESLYWLIEARKPLKATWDRVTGYEVHLPRGSGHTKEHIAEAKRRIDPQTYDVLSEIADLMSHLHRQIRRLELDYDVTSREYTFINGK